MIVGIIGTGTIGTLLIESFIESEALDPEQLIICNRTIQKARKLSNRFQRIKVATNNIALAEKADLIIICTKPKDVFNTLEEIKPFITEEKCLITVTSPISVKQVEAVVNCSIVRVIPSITNRALAGVSLFTYSENCTEEWRNGLFWLFRHISKPVEIDNSQTRIASDIASCGPAFLSYITQMITADAVKTGKIDQKLATKLTENMIIGFAELLHKKHYTLETLQEKVMVPGGITGEGIKILENEIPDIFHQVYAATQKKFEGDIEFTEKQFGATFNQISEK